MQGYDLIMLIVLAMATIFGAIKGFAWQVASIASVIVSYFVAYQFRFDVAEMIQATPPWNQFLAMLILYVGTSFVIWVGFRLLSGAIDRVRLKEFDRHLGAGFGFLKGMIYCLLITMFAMSLLGQNQQRAICQSKSGYYIATALDKGVGILPREIHDVVGPYLANLDSKLKNGQNGQIAPTGNAADGSLGGLLDNDLLRNGLPKIPDGFSDALNSIQIPGGQLPASQASSGSASQSPFFPPQQSARAGANLRPTSQQRPSGQQPGFQQPGFQQPNFGQSEYGQPGYPQAGYGTSGYGTGYDSSATQSQNFGAPNFGAPNTGNSSLRPTEQARQPSYGVPR